jgi:hypothetical protein
MSSYKLFIDDERFPPDDGDESWMIARSSEEAINLVKLFGLPKFISFDHDLGGDDTAMVFIKALIEWILDLEAGGSEEDFSFEYYVHSQNPVGARNIEGIMKSFFAHSMT